MDPLVLDAQTSQVQLGSVLTNFGGEAQDTGEATDLVREPRDLVGRPSFPAPPLAMDLPSID